MKEQILSLINNQDYASALDFFTKHYPGEDYKEADLYIIRSTIYAGLARYDEALDSVFHGLCRYPDNYELYLIKANIHIAKGDFSLSYICYNYALYLCNNAEDSAVIREEFNYFCTHYDTDAYSLGESLADFTGFLIRIGCHEKGFEFLGRFIHTTSKEAGLVWITEKNMLYYIMLEILLCEKNKGPIQITTDLDTFRTLYTNMKIYVRRIWFHFPMEYQKEIVEFITNHKLSGDAVAVMAKYSVVPSALSSVLADLYSLTHIDLLKSYIAFINRQPAYAPSDQSHNMYDYRLDNMCKDLTVQYIDCADTATVQLANSIDISTKQYDYKRFSVIFCGNDALYEKEVLHYIRTLRIPQGYSLDVIVLHNAASMASGYNTAMKLSDAGYKIYIHQDTMILDRDILYRLSDTFNDDIRLIGICGTVHLDSSGKWWKGNSTDNKMALYQDAILNILESISPDCGTPYSTVSCADGIFLATSADILWREDLFDGWHFYDISQCFEFQNAGYRLACLNSDHMLLLHETTMKKDKNNLYEKYCHIFLKEYMA